MSENNLLDRVRAALNRVDDLTGQRPNAAHIAKRIGAHGNTVRSVRNGSSCNAETLLKLADVLGCDQ
jgi:hypothetical protein